MSISRLSFTLRVLARTVLAVSASACAMSAVQRHAVTLADADREAKRAIASENRIDAAKIPARAFSVLPFTVATPDTLLRPLGYAMADFLLTDLSRSPQLLLVDRMHTDAILRELDMVDQGVVDPRTAPRAGRLIGARRILLGTVTVGTGDNIVLSARVVDVIGGTVEQLVTASAPRGRIIDAEKQLALRVFEELSITLTPSQRAQVEQRQSTNLAATVAYGRGVDAEAHGDAQRAVTAFEDAVRLDAAFAVARSQLSGVPGGASGGTQRSGVQRVLTLSAEAINTPAPTRVADVADAPLQSNQIVTLLLTIHIF